MVPVLMANGNVAVNNPNSHNVRGIHVIIEATAARLVYLPPCGPDYSSIESCWSELKVVLRKAKARTYSALDRTLGKGLNTSLCIHYENKGHYCFNVTFGADPLSPS